MNSQHHLNGKRALEGMKLLTNIVYHMKQSGVNEIPADIQAIYIIKRYEALACGSDVEGLAKNISYSRARRIESPEEREKRHGAFDEKISAAINRAQKEHYREIGQRLEQVRERLDSVKGPCDLIDIAKTLEEIRKFSPYLTESCPPVPKELRGVS